MQYLNMECFHASELQEHPGFMGMQLQRIPGQVRRSLSSRGRWNSQYACGIELRFVTEANHFRLFLSTLEGDAHVVVYRGDYLHDAIELTPGTMKCLHITTPQKYCQEHTECLSTVRFNPHVWRIMIPALFPVVHELETFGYSVRPPTKDEVPTRAWLAYGSSITMGTGTSRFELGYLQQAARFLGVDVRNMAMGGACMCEPELADFFAKLQDWDFATFEIGVNMFDEFTVEEFSQRILYMVDTVTSAHPNNPVGLITPFLNAKDILPFEENTVKKWDEYAKVLRNLVKQKNLSRLFLLEGKELLNDPAGLLTDLVHPSDYGNILIAQNIATALRSLLPQEFFTTNSDKKGHHA